MVIKKAAQIPFSRFGLRRHTVYPPPAYWKESKSNETTRLSWQRWPPRLPMRSKGSPVVSKVREASFRALSVGWLLGKKTPPAPGLPQWLRVGGDQKSEKHGNPPACNKGGEAPDFLTFLSTYQSESSAMAQTAPGQPSLQSEKARADNRGSGLELVVAICRKVFRCIAPCWLPIDHQRGCRPHQWGRAEAPWPWELNHSRYPQTR